MTGSGGAAFHESEVPFTDNQFNNENLGETKTFAVSEHSADALKARINRDNSQALNSRAQRAKDAPDLPNAATEAGRTESAPDRPSRADSPAGENVPASPDRAAGRSGSDVRNEGVREAVPPQKKPAAQTALGESRAPKPISRGEARAEQGETVSGGERPQDRTRTAREQRDKSVSAVSPGSVSVRRVSKPAEKRQMTRTRTSEFKVNEVNRKASGKKNKEPAVEYEASDEGGNTVLSVIKAIVYIIFVLITSVALSVFGISVANDMFAFVKSDEAVRVTVPQNVTLDELSQILAEEGVIRYPRIFKLYAIYKAHDDMEYIGGEYTVSPMTNYSGLLAEFKEKEVTGTVRITIPEGYTTDDIIDLFVNRYGIGTREGFIDVIQNSDFSDYWFVRELENGGANPDRIYRLDGYLFPDTYEFYLNSSEQTVINRLLRRFSQIFTREYRNQCAELGFTVDQIVTLASMIEKEAAAPSEFFNVSSVFHNRLKIPDVFPRMESDATVVYAIEHDTGERTVDLRYDSPYNTYLYDGLPPGPIANPSASAMLAALMVPETSFYYFVSGNGVTYFSETKEEHDQRIAEIRQAEAAVSVAEPDAPQSGGADNP